jgi:hypothetical protein
MSRNDSIDDCIGMSIILTRSNFETAFSLIRIDASGSPEVRMPSIASVSESIRVRAAAIWIESDFEIIRRPADKLRGYDRAEIRQQIQPARWAENPSANCRIRRGDFRNHGDR